MSSVAAPDTDRTSRWGRLGARQPGPPGLGSARALSLSAPAGATLGTLGTAALILAVVFVAGGGQRLGPTTSVELALTLGSAMLAAAALLFAPVPRRAWGGATLAWFAALALLTALSITWSVQPSGSWLESSRTLSYVAAFTGALALVRLVPDRWPSVLAGIALAAALACAWALASKVFPDVLAEDALYARLREPFDYWNGVGLMAALGVPPALWSAARRDAVRPVWGALAYPAVGLMLVTVVLVYSRGSLLALGAGLALWFALVPLRLRGLAALAVPAAAAAPVLAWTLAQDSLSKDRVPLDARVEAGHELGILLLAMSVLLLVAGLTIGFVSARRAPGVLARRRAGAAVLVALALVPVAGVTALAASERGLRGSVSHAWDQLTDTSRGTGNSADRLTAAGSSRARYYDEAWKVFRDEPLHGTGAGTFDVARERYRRDTLEVRHAHGYVAQTAADLGVLGLLASLALLVAFALAAARSTGLRPRDRGRPVSAERVGLLTMLAVVVVFGVHSALDWTWFIPGTALPALLCAGWLAGRGPLDEPAGEPATGRGRRLRIAAAVAVLATALTAGWAIWQPQRASDASADALAALDAGAIGQARKDALTASDRDPLSVEPLFELAIIEDAAGRPGAALAALRDAVELQPANARTWRRLGEYDLQLGRPRAALAAARASLYLDPSSVEGRSLFIDATRAERDDRGR